MKLSIIISNRNDVPMLAMTVRSSIEEMSPLPPQSYEIVIVDNSDENVYEILKGVISQTYIQEGVVRIIRQEFPCLYSARDLAAEQAKGEYILCLDSHMLIGHNMIVDMLAFAESKADDPTFGFAYAPVSWAHQHERHSKHDRNMKERETGDWGTLYNYARTVTWKGMPWICKRSWYNEPEKGMNGYGTLAKKRVSWGGGDMHLGIKPWLLGFKNWAVPCRPGIHMGPFPGIDSLSKDKNVTKVSSPGMWDHYRLWSKSGDTPTGIGFLIACYVCGGIPMMERNKPTITKHYGRFINVDKYWDKAIELAEEEKQWMDSRRVYTMEALMEAHPWDN